MFFTTIKKVLKSKIKSGKTLEAADGTLALHRNERQVLHLLPHHTKKPRTPQQGGGV